MERAHRTTLQLKVLSAAVIVYEGAAGALNCELPASFCTLGAATFSDGLHGGVPAVASSPYASEHIGTHGLWTGQKSSEPKTTSVS